jgi:hypothetical protein
MDNSDDKLHRRDFLQKSAVVAAGSAALCSTALSYSRIAGANDRISLGHIGVGNRGSELDGIVARLKDSKNVEMTAVCDLWSHNLERAVAANEKRYGKGPRAFKHPQELLALKDVLPGRGVSGVLGLERRHFCLARRPREPRYIPGAVHVFARLAGQLFDEFRQ